MSKKYHWYERLFFRLQITEKKCWKLITLLLLMLFFSQVLLANFTLRKYLVLTEKYEGKPVKFYKSLSRMTCNRP